MGGLEGLSEMLRTSPVQSQSVARVAVHIHFIYSLSPMVVLVDLFGLQYSWRSFSKSWIQLIHTCKRYRPEIMSNRWVLSTILIDDRARLGRDLIATK